MLGVKLPSIKAPLDVLCSVYSIWPSARVYTLQCTLLYRRYTYTYVNSILGTQYQKHTCLITWHHDIQSICVLYWEYRVVCPKFGHPALTSSYKKYKFLQVKNSFATIVNGLSGFRFVSAFEWQFIIFVACLQHLQIV